MDLWLPMLQQRRKQSTATTHSASTADIFSLPRDQHDGVASTQSSFPPSSPGSHFETFGNATLYVVSGCSQPLIMTLCKHAGLADSKCQLHMFFYALGPCVMIVVPMISRSRNDKNNTTTTTWPSNRIMIAKAAGICLFDIVCTLANYTGAAMAGPSIFAIVYSSVTIWTALFSQLLLGRILQKYQWMAIFIVFGGLLITATDSLELGDEVGTGLVLILIGSAMHALTYVMSEAIMKTSATTEQQPLSSQQNNAIQSLVAATTMGMWQLVYTIPRFDERIRQQMEAAGTTHFKAISILLILAFSNWIHSSTFFYTLRHFPGGSTSAGVMKGLQAVLVFVVTHFVYCDSGMGGPEMCFSKKKLLALFTVSGGVMGYGFATRQSSLKHDSTIGQGSTFKRKTTMMDHPYKDERRSMQDFGDGYHMA